MSVSTQPGQIAFTWTSSDASSAASERTSPSRPGLGGAVPRVPRDGDPREDRRQHDDVARLGPRREMPERRADAVVGPVEVGRDEVVEAVPALVVLAVPPADAAARDERVDGPELARGAGDGRRRRPSRSRMSHGAIQTSPSDRRGRLVEAGASRATSVTAAPSSCQPKGDRAPDPPAGSGHHHMPVAHPLSTRRNLRGFRRRIPLHPTAAKA